MYYSVKDCEAYSKNPASNKPLIQCEYNHTMGNSGGNLAEVLDNLSRVIRERFKIRRQIRVITAHGRLTGWILAGMPVAMAVYMLFSRPEHFRLLLDDPLGNQMVAVAIGMQIVGAFLIYKISDIEY